MMPKNCEKQMTKFCAYVPLRKCHKSVEVMLGNELGSSWRNFGAMHKL
jgi:hypothetical protein